MHKEEDIELCPYNGRVISTTEGSRPSRWPVPSDDFDASASGEISRASCDTWVQWEFSCVLFVLSFAYSWEALMIEQMSSLTSRRCWKSPMIPGLPTKGLSNRLPHSLYCYKSPGCVSSPRGLINRRFSLWHGEWQGDCLTVNSESCTFRWTVDN